MSRLRADIPVNEVLRRGLDAEGRGDRRATLFSRNVDLGAWSDDVAGEGHCAASSQRRCDNMKGLDAVIYIVVAL